MIEHYTDECINIIRNVRLKVDEVDGLVSSLVLMKTASSTYLIFI